MNQETPKVFLSYAWGNQRTEEIVESVAQFLTKNGVYVYYDKWDISAGNDLNAFMEKMVKDEAVSKVLIFCDETYCIKANSRNGGVGTETQIISFEVYNNTEQSKFIPISLGIDENGRFRLPIYLKSRSAIDLTSDELWEEATETILRDIFGQPLRKRPSLGKKPDFENPIFQSKLHLSGKLNRLEKANSQNERIKLLKNIVDETLISLAQTISNCTIDNYLKVYSSTLPFRNFLVDAVDKAHEADEAFWNCLSAILEKTHNVLINVRRDNDVVKELGELLIREIFICLVATLRIEEDYKGIYYLLHKTYFLKYTYKEKPSMISEFWHYPLILEDQIKPHIEDKKNKHTLAGDILVTERLHLPILSKQSLSEADLIIFQLSQLLSKESNESVQWFPHLYVYCDNSQIIWRRLVSKTEASKIMDIVGAKDLDSLKEIILSTQYFQPVGYHSCFGGAAPIASYVKAEDIGHKF